MKRALPRRKGGAKAHAKRSAGRKRRFTAPFACRLIRLPARVIPRAALAAEPAFGFRSARNDVILISHEGSASERIFFRPAALRMLEILPVFLALLSLQGEKISRSDYPAFMEDQYKRRSRRRLIRFRHFALVSTGSYSCGKQIVIAVPLPGSLCARTLPACIRAMVSTMERPSPLPPSARLRALSAR